MEIRSGTVIGEQDRTTTDLAADSPLLAVALPSEQVIGRTAVGDLLPGEMVRPDAHLHPPHRQEAGPGLATMPVSFEDADVSLFLIPLTDRHPLNSGQLLRPDATERGRRREGAEGRRRA